MERKVYDLDAMASEGRKTIDASWSPRKKKIIGGACVAGAVLVVGGGAWAMAATAPARLPRTAQEAVAVMASGKFKGMTSERKAQYTAEAGRLFREMSEEDRRAMFRDEKTREAMRAMMEERMTDAAKKFARGESLEGIWGQRPQGPRPEGRPERPEGERPQLTEEERAQRMQQARDRMTQAMKDQVMTGNAQNGSLTGEMFKRMGAGGGRGGMFGGRGGGGGGGRGR